MQLRRAALILLCYAVCGLAAGWYAGHMRGRNPIQDVGRIGNNATRSPFGEDINKKNWLFHGGDLRTLGSSLLDAARNLRTHRGQDSRLVGLYFDRWVIEASLRLAEEKGRLATGTTSGLFGRDLPLVHDFESSVAGINFILSQTQPSDVLNSLLRHIIMRAANLDGGRLLAFINEAVPVMFRASAKAAAYEVLAEQDWELSLKTMLAHEASGFHERGGVIAAAVKAGARKEPLRVIDEVKAALPAGPRRTEIITNVLANVGPGLPGMQYEKMFNEFLSDGAEEKLPAPARLGVIRGFFGVVGKSEPILAGELANSLEIEGFHNAAKAAIDNSNLDEKPQ